MTMPQPAAHDILVPVAPQRSIPSAATVTALPTVRTARVRHYLMCRPTYFEVSYAINPWMDPDHPVNVELAMRQWESLRDAYRSLGHRVDEITAVPGLPDMVFAANGATVIDGKALGAQFKYPQRADEAPAYRAWLERAGYEVQVAKSIHEGEGDLLFSERYVLAGTGFRTEVTAHAEAQEYFGRPVITLRLVDPRYYHLDTALFVLDEENVAYFPGAFSPGSREALTRLFPDAVPADETDAAVLGLNAVSDGRHVVLPAEAKGLARALTERGYEPVPVELSELRKAGGGPKCCTLELRP